MNLLLRVIIAIAAGIGAGFLFPEWLSRCFATFNAVFSSFLGFLIPLLIVGFVAPAIAELGKKAGKMLIVTALIAYLMTFSVGLLAYFTASTTFPLLISADAYVVADVAASASGILPYFTMEISPMFSVMTALVLAFVLGLGVARLSTDSLRHGLADFREIIRWAISRIIIPCLPVYIFGIFLNMTITGQVGPILVTFSKIILVTQVSDLGFRRSVHRL